MSKKRCVVFSRISLACIQQKISRLAPRAPPENELVERKWRTPFLRCFSSFGELCPGLVLISSPVAKCAYKQHRYRNKCIATGSICAWALSVLTATLSTEDRVEFPTNPKFHPILYQNSAQVFIYPAVGMDTTFSISSTQVLNYMIQKQGTETLPSL